MLADTFMDNVKLRKRVNFIMRCALTGKMSRNSNEDPAKIDLVETHYSVVLYFFFLSKNFTVIITGTNHLILMVDLTKHVVKIM